MNSKNPHQLLLALVKILNKLKIPYLVTGGIAVLVWGRIRFTADIDIVIELEKTKVQALIEALKLLGKSAYIDMDAIREALKHYGEFNFIDGDSGLKVDFWILNETDPFDIMRFKRRIFKSIGAQRIAFTSPEDLILVKLKWYKASISNRQWEDVISIMNISGMNLDRIYLYKWAKRLGVGNLWKKLLRIC